MTAVGQIRHRRPSKIKTLRVRTRNVLSQYRSGELNNLVHATQEYEYDIDLLDMQDVRRLGKSVLD
jgi:hypothetical protein